MNSKTPISILKTGITLFIAAATSAGTLAATAPNVSGTWNWTTEGRNGETRESSLTLKQDGDKVTGAVKGRRGDTAIQDGKIDGNKLSFKTTRETQDRTFTANYKGTIEGNTIKGTIAMAFGEREFEREWVAKRKSVDPSGTWAWTMLRDNGETWEADLKLKRDGDAIVGAFSQEDSDFTLEIQHGKMKGSTLTFETVFEGNGQSMTIKNSAVITGKTMKGKSEGATPDGETFSNEWEAKLK